MTHSHADPAAECPGRLRYMECWTDSRMGRRGRVNRVAARYTCDECGEDVTLWRRQVDPPEGQLVPLVELRFEL